MLVESRFASFVMRAVPDSIRLGTCSIRNSVQSRLMASYEVAKFSATGGRLNSLSLGRSLVLIPGSHISCVRSSAGFQSLSNWRLSTFVAKNHHCNTTSSGSNRWTFFSNIGRSSWRWSSRCLMIWMVSGELNLRMAVRDLLGEMIDVPPATWENPSRLWFWASLMPTGQEKHRMHDRIPCRLK